MLIIYSIKFIIIIVSIIVASLSIILPVYYLVYKKTSSSSSNVLPIPDCPSCSSVKTCTICQANVPCPPAVICKTCPPVVTCTKCPTCPPDIICPLCPTCPTCPPVKISGTQYVDMGYCTPAYTPSSVLIPVSTKLTLLNYTLYIDNDPAYSTKPIINGTVLTIMALIFFNDDTTSLNPIILYTGTNYDLSISLSGQGTALLCSTINIDNPTLDQSLYTGQYTILNFPKQEKINAATVLNTYFTQNPPTATQKSYSVMFTVFGGAFENITPDTPMYSATSVAYGIS